MGVDSTIWITSEPVVVEPIDWARVAERFWGDRVEDELREMERGDWRQQYTARHVRGKLAYGWGRESFGECAAWRVANLGAALASAGMLATIEARARAEQRAWSRS